MFSKSFKISRDINDSYLRSLKTSLRNTEADLKRIGIELKNPKAKLGRAIGSLPFVKEPAEKKRFKTF